MFVKVLIVTSQENDWEAEISNALSPVGIQKFRSNGSMKISNELFEFDIRRAVAPSLRVRWYDIYIIDRRLSSEEEDIIMGMSRGNRIIRTDSSYVRVAQR